MRSRVPPRPYTSRAEAPPQPIPPERRRGRPPDERRAPRAPPPSHRQRLHSEIARKRAMRHTAAPRSAETDSTFRVRHPRCQASGKAREATVGLRARSPLRHPTTTESTNRAQTRRLPEDRGQPPTGWWVRVDAADPSGESLNREAGAVAERVTGQHRWKAALPQFRVARTLLLRL